MNMSLTAFMTLYFTDVLGLNPAIIGIMLMVSRISDAVTDIMIGYIVDRTKTRWGKARPYEFAIVFLWLFIFMMYSTPYMSPVATYVWVFLLILCRILSALQFFMEMSRYTWSVL